LDELDGAVVVTMAVMRMMKATLHQVINVIAVWDRLVAAAGAMGVGVRAGRGLAVGRVLAVHGQRVLVAVVAVGMMQVAVVQVIHVIVVLDGRVAAVLAVLMGVVLMSVAGGHIEQSSISQSRLWRGA
jgi:hypothetical protein